MVEQCISLMKASKMNPSLKMKSEWLLPLVLTQNECLILNEFNTE